MKVTSTLRIICRSALTDQFEKLVNSSLVGNRRQLTLVINHLIFCLSQLPERLVSNDPTGVLDQFIAEVKLISATIDAGIIHDAGYEPFDSRSCAARTT